MTEAGEAVVRGHCPKCGPHRRSEVKGQFTKSERDDENGVWGQTDYRILECCGCLTVYMQTESVFSEDIEHRRNADGEWEEYLNPTIEHWPAALKRPLPEWAIHVRFLDPNLGSLFSDIYGCLNADLLVPATVAIRTAFDSATELLGIDPAKRFYEKLDDLRTLGKISDDERATLDVVVNSGSAAAHRGWRPTFDQLDTLVSLIETFFHRTFVLGDEANKIKAAMPSRQQKQAPVTAPSTSTSP